jgi:DNA (cytosine-5)-methyltransferase 1
MISIRDKLPLKEQLEVIEKCIANNQPLGDLLKQRGLTYDALRYMEYACSETISEAELLELRDKKTPCMPAVSFFSGAGGLNLGFEYAGFDNCVSIEINEIFCNTLRVNNPNKAIIGPPNSDGDVRNREKIAAELEKVIGTNKPFEGVFHGGPPCQSFSVAANQRFSKDSDKFKRQGFEDGEKGELIFDYLWYIKTFLPKAFLIENVDGIADCDGHDKIKAILDNLASKGYNILSPQIINAAYYGVPQNRLRWIIIGTRGKRPIEFPQSENFPASCHSVFERDFNGVDNHQTREHAAESVKRYMFLTYGMRDKLGRVDRLNPYQPAKTVIAGGTKGGGRSHLHPYSPRTLTVRECARLQTFPDSYVFTGATARQFTQVGNAVPPLLAYKIAEQIKKGL